MTKRSKNRYFQNLDMNLGSWVVGSRICYGMRTVLCLRKYAVQSTATECAYSGVGGWTAITERPPKAVYEEPPAGIQVPRGGYKPVQRRYTQSTGRSGSSSIIHLRTLLSLFHIRLPPLLTNQSCLEWSLGTVYVQGDQFNIAVFLWYLEGTVHETSHFFQDTRKTRPCLTGHPVYNTIETTSLFPPFLLPHSLLYLPFPLLFWLNDRW